MRYVLLFEKKGVASYIGHLDTQRLWTRLLRMAGVSLAYSQGFNPHPKLSLASPLPLSLESNCEYLEFATTKELDIAKLKGDLKIKLPLGFDVIDIYERDIDYAKSLAFYAHSATYSIHTDGFPDIGEIVEKFMANQTIIVSKRSKKTNKLRDIDIRSQIIDFYPTHTYGKKVLFFAKLLTANNATLSPLALLEEFYSKYGYTFDATNTKITRLGLFGKDDKGLEQY